MPLAKREKRRGPKREFVFKITYFTPRGNYWHTTEVTWEIHTKSDSDPMPMMADAAAKLRGMRGNGPESMPGLASDVDDWDGYILLECRQGFPVLILPEEN